MCVGIRAALNSLPPAAARWIVDLSDFHQVREALQADVDAITHGLFESHYIGDIGNTVADRLTSEPEVVALFQSLALARIAPDALRAVIVRAADTAFQIVGEYVAPKIVSGILPDATSPQPRRAQFSQTPAPSGISKAGVAKGKAAAKNERRPQK
jgi:hypothetical protein